MALDDTKGQLKVNSVTQKLYTTKPRLIKAA